MGGGDLTRRAALGWLVGLALLGAAGCREEAPPTPAAPEAARIVSLAPNVTEIAFEIGLGPQIVGVSSFDTYPPEVASRQRLGGLLDPDLERLTALKPDLILLNAAATQVEEHAQRLSLRSARFPSDTLEDVRATYTRLGELTGRQAEARAALQRLDDGMGPPAAPRGLRVLLVVGRSPGTLEQLTAVGPGSFLDAALTRAGGENAMAGAQGMWPQVDKEALLRADPDLIIELTQEAPADLTAYLAPWQQLPALRAVREGRVVVVSGDHLLIPGPRLVQTTQALRAAVERAAPVK